MNLKNFIEEVTSSILDATEHLSIKHDRDIKLHHQDNKYIDFDVAVTVEDAENKSTGGGIKIWKYVEAKGDLSSESKNSTTTRIRFSLFVNSQKREEQEKDRKQMQQRNYN